MSRFEPIYGVASEPKRFRIYTMIGGLERVAFKLDRENQLQLQPINENDFASNVVHDDSHGVFYYDGVSVAYESYVDLDFCAYREWCNAK
jgi:hypothetical protein